jgi:hypothetical protein
MLSFSFCAATARTDLTAEPRQALRFSEAETLHTDPLAKLARNSITWSGCWRLPQKNQLSVQVQQKLRRVFETLSRRPGTQRIQIDSAIRPGSAARPIGQTTNPMSDYRPSVSLFPSLAKLARNSITWRSCCRVVLHCRFSIRLQQDVTPVVRTLARRPGREKVFRSLPCTGRCEQFDPLAKLLTPGLIKHHLPAQLVLAERK